MKCGLDDFQRAFFLQIVNAMRLELCLCNAITPLVNAIAKLVMMLESAMHVLSTILETKLETAKNVIVIVQDHPHCNAMLTENAPAKVGILGTSVINV